MSEKIKILDEVFSKFIRKRGYDSHTGYNQCFTCGKTMDWKQLQCGHYIPRGNMSLRFDLKNCFPQCHDCNVTKRGNLKVYRSRLIQEFGIVHVYYLEEKKEEFKQYSDFELDILIAYYKKLTK